MKALFFYHCKLDSHIVVCIQRWVEKLRSMSLCLSLSFNSVFQFENQYKRLRENSNVNIAQRHFANIKINVEYDKIFKSFVSIGIKINSRNNCAMGKRKVLSTLCQVCKKICVIAKWSTERL